MAASRTPWLIALPVAGLFVALLVRGNPGGHRSETPATATPRPGGVLRLSAPAIVPRPAPVTRQRPTAAIDPVRGQMVLFGGVDQSPPYGDLGDTWVFDGTRWTRSRPATSPQPRFAGVMAFDPGSSRLLLFGGETRDPSPRLLDDTWSWDGSTWTRERTDAAPAPGTAAVAMAGDAGRRSVVLVTGGPLGDGPFETWTWTGSAWLLRHPPAGTPPVRVAADDPARGDVVAVAVNRTSGARATWRWAGEAWQQVATTETPAIEPLTVTMAGDAQTHQALLVEEAFLGPDGVARGGTSTWDGSTWTHRPGPVPDDLISPLERPDSTEAIWATDRGRLVMLGGGSGDDAYRREWAWNGAAWQPVHG